MNVVIVEDELAASDNLTYLLQHIDSTIKVIKVLDSVKASVAYFSKNQNAELVFMDIHLADGISFEIFEQIPMTVPVIFTTAYNQYTLKAFKVNSIDYLLKPLDQDELADAIQQFKEQKKEKGIANDQIKGLLDLVKEKERTYKTTFLINHRDQLIPLKTVDIAYFLIDTGVVKATTFDNKSYAIDGKLEELEEELDPNNFYRINRQCILRRDALSKIKQYFNGKLIVEVRPVSKEQIVVSKAKAGDFKTWVAN
ncbi:LytR/AlgR family response regulator transcription factor [Maribacter chungangensis]|uniref:LytR/AlgR family response regulator transcription factor n=1 Tax=Maribacter chungangensis TaxID=1069117 RepID=A0ABW3B7L8_9FLAO